MPGRYLSVSQSHVPSINDTSANDFPITSDGKQIVYLVLDLLIAYAISISSYQKVSMIVT